MLASRPALDLPLGMRRCTKTACGREAVATCAFSYAEKQVWLAPLRREPDPSSYDLCEDHAITLRVPMGWGLEDLRPRPASAQSTLLP